MTTTHAATALALIIACSARAAERGHPQPPGPAATGSGPASQPAAAPEQDDPFAQLPYESLVKRDHEGHIVPPAEPVSWAALRRARGIPTEDWARVRARLLERRRECERIALRNLDLVEMIESGGLEKIEGDARQVIKSTTEITGPLKPDQVDFCVVLTQDGTLSPAQSNAARKLVSDYSTIVIAEGRAGIKAVIAGNPAGMSAVRRMCLLPADETVWSYRGLVSETARSLDRAFAAAKWPEGKPPNLDSQRAAVNAASGDARRDRMRDLLAALTLEQRRALLAATAETRPAPEDGKTK